MQKVKTVYILVGVPSSGKTWVSSQLAHVANVIEHDDFREPGSYLRALLTTWNKGKSDSRSIIANTPFGLSELMRSLHENGVKVEPVFVIENEQVLKDRYLEREGKSIASGHLTRQHTYRRRATELGSFVGTSNEVLKHLKEKV